jgi:hypothetical protein
MYNLDEKHRFSSKTMIFMKITKIRLKFKKKKNRYLMFVFNQYLNKFKPIGEIMEGVPS